MSHVVVRAFAAERQALRQRFPRRRADDRQFVVDPRLLLADAPSRRHGAGNACRGSGNEARRRCGGADHGVRRGRPRQERAARRLRSTGRRRGEAARADQCHAQGPQPVPHHRHAGQAARRCRQGRRHGDIRHRREASRHEGRDRRGLAGVRRHARLVQRSGGVAGARRASGRQARQRRGGDRGSLLGREERSRGWRGHVRRWARTRALTTADVVAALAKAAEKPGAVAKNEGDAEAALAQRRNEARSRLRESVPRPCHDGADELHGARDAGRLRHLGRHADSERGPGGRRSRPSG